MVRSQVPPSLPEGTQLRRVLDRMGEPRKEPHRESDPGSPSHWEQRQLLVQLSQNRGALNSDLVEFLVWEQLETSNVMGNDVPLEGLLSIFDARQDWGLTSQSGRHQLSYPPFRVGRVIEDL